MSVLDRLTSAPGVYWGEGHGPTGGYFVARVALQTQSDNSITFVYEAWSTQGGLQHAESARIARTGDSVTLAATSNGGDDTMIFREGDPGVFGSVGSQKVGLVITTEDQHLTFSWWWTGRDGTLREQSRAVVAPMRQIVAPPDVPGADVPGADIPGADIPESRVGVAANSDSTESSDDEQAFHAEPDDDLDQDDLDHEDVDHEDDIDEPASGERSPHTPPPPQLITLPPSGGQTPVAAPTTGPTQTQVQSPAATQTRQSDIARHLVAVTGNPTTAQPEPHTPAETSSGQVPWPGILVLHGTSTGLVAQRLAARLTRAAVVRTDLFDRAVRGTAGRPDPVLRQRIAVSVVQGYAATGHPVILHGAGSRAEHEQLVAAIAEAGLSPVRLVDVADGEDYGEVARRLIESD